jgi:hypothetical protein
MQRRLLALAALAAAALVLWLVWAGEQPAPDHAAAPTTREAADGDASQLQGPPVQRAQRPPVRTELPPEKKVHGSTGGAPPDPRVHGQLSRAGLPVRDREVHVMGSPRRGGVFVQVTRTDALGQYGFQVPGAGAYRVYAGWDGMTQVPPAGRADRPAEPTQTQTAPASKEVEIEDQPVACDLVLPAGSMRVTTVDASTRLPLADVEVAMTWSSGTDLTGHTDRDGQMLATDLPPGPCTVALALRGYRAPPPCVVDTTTPCPEERVLLLEPACILDVRVCDARGRLVAMEEAPAIEVVHSVTGAVSAPRRFRPGHGRRPPVAVQFEDLAEGPYAVRVADQLAERDGEPTVRYQCAEALAPVVISVVPGRPAEAEFRVRWRSYVEIQGVPQDHQGPAPALRVERLDANGIRRALPSPQPSIRNSRPPLFAGWLAAGSYWLTFTGAQGQVHRETLQVADEAIRKTFPLPW